MKLSKRTILLAVLLCLLLSFSAAFCGATARTAEDETTASVSSEDTEAQASEVEESAEESEEKATEQKEVSSCQGLDIRQLNDAWVTYKDDTQVRYSGVAQNKYGWWYCNNGVVDFTYTGFAENDYGWWRIEKGKVNFAYSDIVEATVNDTKGWWLVRNGKVRTDLTTIAQNKHGWWYCKKGKVDFTSNSVEQNEYGWWKLKNGKVDFSYTGVAKNKHGWWRIENGKVNFGFNGLARNEYGWWLCQNGKVNFSYSGSYGSYTIKNGKVTWPLYTVKYNGNGATSGIMAESSQLTGYAYPLETNAYEKTGYTFAGWSKNKASYANLLNGTAAPGAIGSGSGTGRWANSAWRSASTNDGTRTIVSISNAPATGITKGFHVVGSNHVDLAQDKVPITVGQIYTISCYVKGTGKLRLQVGSPALSSYLVSTQKVTSSSSWTRLSATFVASNTFVNNGTVSVYFGTYGASNDFTICGMKLEAHGEPTAYTTSGTSGTIYTPGQNVKDLGSSGATVTLYAVWNPTTYQVHFDGNGATSGSMADQTLVTGRDIALNNYQFTRSGYLFRGWNTKADGSGTHYGNQASVNNLVKGGSSITLYAEWTKSSGTISGTKVTTVYPGNTDKLIKDAQGSCVVEKGGTKYLVVCFVRNTSKYLMGDSSDYESSVVMVNLSTGKTVRSAQGLKLDHANGMCYNPKTGHFYVTCYGDITWQSGIVELDWNLNYVTKHEVADYPHCGSISCYNNQYYVLYALGNHKYKFLTLDSNFKVIKTSALLSGYEDRFVTQGTATDGTYLYTISIDKNDSNWKTRQRLNLYDMEGNLLGLYALNFSTEVEDMTYLNNTLYLTDNYSKSSSLYTVAGAGK